MTSKELLALPAAKSRFIEPMYARLVNTLPVGSEWLYEIKFDGYRCLAARHGNQVTLWSRRGNVFTEQFPGIAAACKRLPMETLVDGEIVAMDENGRISFNLLQHHRSKARALLFYAFDVLIYRERSLLKEPLTARRELLSQLFTAMGKATPIGLSEPIEGSATDLIGLAKEIGFEGIIAKRRNSPYESGRRSGAWSKYKVNRGQEFVIGGYTPGNPFDALIVGYYDGDKLYYVGKVRNGFVPRLRQEVYRLFKGSETSRCPFINLPEKRRTMWALTAEQMKECVWLKPELVAQIEFTEWTPDGHLRHSRFAGLRQDKKPNEVMREMPT
jgi:DNA ligase D-like protein (predicted ligase)